METSSRMLSLNLSESAGMHFPNFHAYLRSLDLWNRDSITPNQDFIISSHPHCKNLYIATAGSFHGWKFLPVIGDYVVQLLDGKLHEDLVKRWAWDREQAGSAHGKMLPRRELKDLL
jgi:glycine/D-amino acid oxidase-like deaminating enzyme